MQHVEVRTVRTRILGTERTGVKTCPFFSFVVGRNGLLLRIRPCRNGLTFTVPADHAATDTAISYAVAGAIICTCAAKARCC